MRNEASESNVRGLYLIGEIAGTPLIKLGLNRGRAVIDTIVDTDLGSAPAGWDPAERSGRWHDVVIIGAGSAGLGAADRCEELGLDYLVIEQERAAQLIRNFTKDKPLYMEPLDEPNRTRLFCEECAKEELLERWDRQIAELGIKAHLHEFETVESIQRLGDRDGFKVTTDKGEHFARRVVMAIGMGGNPRKLDVPGELEHAARIDQNVADPDVYRDRDLVVFGAGDVACEAAIALSDRGNRVAMVAPDREFTFPKKRNVDGVMSRVETGRIHLYLGHAAEAIGPQTVTIDGDGLRTDGLRSVTQVEMDAAGLDAAHHAVDVPLLRKGELAVRRHHGNPVAAVGQCDGSLAGNVTGAEDHEIPVPVHVRVRDVLVDPSGVLELARHVELSRIAAHSDGHHHAAGEVLALVGRHLEAVAVAEPLNALDGLELVEVGLDAQLGDLPVPSFQQLFLGAFLAEQTRPVRFVERLHVQRLVLGEVADELCGTLLLDDQVVEAELLAAVRRPEARRARPDDHHVVPSAAAFGGIPAGGCASEIGVDDRVDHGAAAIETELDQRRAGNLPDQVQAAHVRLARFVPHGEPTRSRWIEAPIEE